VFYLDGLPAGKFGCWRLDISQTWCAKPETKMTVAERDVHLQRIKAMQVEREAAEAAKHQEAATEASKRWKDAQACTAHPYLTATRREATSSAK